MFVKVAIMQPYFFPYIGYWQLINVADIFVIYDNVQYIKRGYINRNRILLDGVEKWITLPVKKDNRHMEIKDRSLSNTFENEKFNLLKLIKHAYKQAPNFEVIYNIIESTILSGEDNLFEFVYKSIKAIINYLEIDTKIILASEILISSDSKGQNRIIEICKNLKAEEYINPIGGLNLYSKEEFRLQGIDLSFIKTGNIRYSQFGNDFVPNLSIIDVLMFNSIEEVKKMLIDYSLV
jgi:hypothetical protein